MKTVAAMLASVIAAVGIGGTATNTPTTIAPCVTIDRTLNSGMSGADVMKLQQFLGVKPTGYFGPLSAQKLIAWQIAHNIITSAKSPGAGTTGPKTRAALRCASPVVSPAPATKISPPKINTPVATTSPTSSPTISPVSPPAPPVISSGGGGSSVPQCPSFTTPQPPASQCTTGQWMVIQDEAGCPAEWNCDDPNAVE